MTTCIVVTLASPTCSLCDGKEEEPVVSTGETRRLTDKLRLAPEVFCSIVRVAFLWSWRPLAETQHQANLR